jgi:hypothetical protein
VTKTCVRGRTTCPARTSHWRTAPQPHCHRTATARWLDGLA